MTIKPFGPHIFPKYEFIKNSVRIYKPNLNKNLIGKGAKRK